MLNRLKKRARPLNGLVLGALMALTALPAAAAEQAARIEVGQTAPGFELKASDGEMYKLSQLKDEKTLVLVFFRGTW